MDPAVRGISSWALVTAPVWINYQTNFQLSGTAVMSHHKKRIGVNFTPILILLLTTVTTNQY